jgi:hypothetical protein
MEKKRTVLGAIRIPAERGGRVAIRIVFDMGRSYPWAASHDRGRILLHGAKFFRHGALQEKDLEMALLHELSHASDEANLHGMPVYRRFEEKLRRMGKTEDFKRQLDASLKASGVFEDAFLSDEDPIEVRAAYRAKLACGDAAVVRLLSSYEMARAEMEKFLSVYLLKRFEDRMVEGYPGADGDYYRSEGELRARMTTMRAEALHVLGRRREEKEVLRAVKATRSYRALRRHLTLAQLAAIAADVSRTIASGGR